MFKGLIDENDVRINLIRKLVNVRIAIAIENRMEKNKTENYIEFKR